MADHDTPHKDGPEEDTHKVVDKAHGRLTKKIGPFSTWVWILMGTGGAVVLVLLYRSNTSRSSASAEKPDTSTVGGSQTGIDSGAYNDPNGGIGEGGSTAGSVDNGGAAMLDQPATNDSYPDDGTGFNVTLTGGGPPEAGPPTTNNAKKTSPAKKTHAHAAAKKKAAASAAKAKANPAAKSSHSPAAKVAPSHSAAGHATAHATAAERAHNARVKAAEQRQHARQQAQSKRVEKDVEKGLASSNERAHALALKHAREQAEREAKQREAAAAKKRAEEAKRKAEAARKRRR